MRLLTILTAFLLLFIRGLTGATVTVSTAAQLVSAINGASSGDTILMNNGTYAITSSGPTHGSGDPNIGIDLFIPITIKSINGASNVSLTFTGMYQAIRIGSPNVTLDGITITGAQWGVGALDVTNSHGGQLTGVVLRNLSVGVSGSGGVPIDFIGTSNSVIELCTVQNAPDRAISVEAQSNYDFIISNTVQQTSGSDGILIQVSDHNVIAGNSVNNTTFDGIFLYGAQYNYVGQNTIISPHSGITFSPFSPGTSSARFSNRNYAGNNLMVLNDKVGSDGFWINYDSDWNMVYLNDATGANENGMALFNSIGNYIRGNYFHQNPHGGIFLTKDAASGPTVPAYNVIQQNYLAKHPANGGVTTNNTSNNDVGFNYIAGDPALLPQNIAGLLIQNTSNSVFYANLIRDLEIGEQIDSNTTSTSLYLNRHLNSPNHYTFAGASVQWDSGSTVLGGSYYYDFTSANGNPSNGSTPYTNILQDNSGDRGLYQDRYPYQSESLGKAYLVSAFLPSAGEGLAAGTPKTIAWNSQGCVLVDLTLLDSGNNSTSVASNYPDYGNYRWIVPAVTSGFYTIRVDCKDSGGSVHATSMSPQFQITSSDLVLLSPQANLIQEGNSTMLVSWVKSANVTSTVDVYIRYSDSSPYSLLQGGVTNDYVRVSAPVVSSNRVSVRLVSGNFADSTDGWFTIRGNSAGQFTSPAGPTNLYVGTPFPIEWISPQNTDYVDIDLINGGTTRNIATKLADFSKYLMLVPDLQGNAALRLTFHTSSGTVLQQISSPALTISTSASQPASMVATAGAPQSAPINTTFGTSMQVQLKDAGSNPVSGVLVTFAAPSGGPSGAFSGSATVATNSQGFATAPAFTANGIGGNYLVTATAGALYTTFSLTNKWTETITFNALSNVAYGTAPFTISATTDSGLPVTFTSNTTAVCTVSGSTVTIVSAGGCSITATQSGDAVHTAAAPVTQSFTVQFVDVPSSSYYFSAINLLAQRGITSGCGNNNYCPQQNITRWQMAVFIVRAVEGSDNFPYSQTPYFSDVPANAQGFQWIQKMYELGITTGCGGGNYCPNDNVTRDQMAVFIIRARYGASAAFTYPGTPIFTDVPASETYFRWIQRLSQDGITAGCGSNTYCPGSPVIRGDMAIFLMRGAFNQLLPSGTPVVTSISPATLAPGASGAFTVTGSNTHFAQGTTTLSPIPGVTIGTITVSGSTSLTVQLSAASNAATQPDSIVAITGSEQAVLPNGLRIQ